MRTSANRKWIDLGTPNTKRRPGYPEYQTELSGRPGWTNQARWRKGIGHVGLDSVTSGEDPMVAAAMATSPTRHTSVSVRPGWEGFADQWAERCHESA